MLDGKQNPSVKRGNIQLFNINFFRKELMARIIAKIGEVSSEMLLRFFV